MLKRPNPNGISNASVLKRAVNARQIVQRRADDWVVDFGLDLPEAEAALFEEPFGVVSKQVAPKRIAGRDRSQAKWWWLHARPSPKYRAALEVLPRVIATPCVSKYRLFVPLVCTELADHAVVVFSRADDATFGILHSRFHEIWALRLGTSLEDRPRYTPTTCFETFPFPAGLTPRDTAHQQTETLADGAVIPLFSAASVAPTREHAIAIARAAKRLNDLRERWLNPPEWTERVPEVIPLGIDVSPYPDRILPRANLGAAELADLKKRTLTNLYNQRPAWLADAHVALDAAVAAAYGRADYTAAMPDNEILARLLALNHERANVSKA